ALPAGCVHAGAPAVPLHTSVVQTLASSVQAVPAGCTASAGQAVLVPVQVSATSQASAAARHSVPAAVNAQSMLQQEPLVPLLAPSSHCSLPSTVPFPQPAV